MYNYFFSFFSVLVGALFVLVFRPSNKKNLNLLLTFSGAFLLGTTVFVLLPEVFEDIETQKKIGIWIMIGILLQKILEYYSLGAEHGHLQASDAKISKIPKLLFISLGIHAVLEGVPIHHSERFLVGIIIHKVPIAMILTTFLLTTKISRKNIFLVLITFSLMTPLGTLLSDNFNIMNSYYEETIALVIGIFLHVSTGILFETNQSHQFNITKLLVVLLATTMAYVL